MSSKISGGIHSLTLTIKTNHGLLLQERTRENSGYIGKTKEGDEKPLQHNIVEIETQPS